MRFGDDSFRVAHRMARSRLDEEIARRKRAPPLVCVDRHFGPEGGCAPHQDSVVHVALPGSGARARLLKRLGQWFSTTDTLRAMREQ